MAALRPAIPPPTTRMPRSRLVGASPLPFMGLGDAGLEGHLVQLPLPTLGVAPRVHEALPVLLVELGVVAPVVVARPAGLLPEEHVAQAGLGRADPVPHLPAAQEVVEVARP